MTITIEKSQKTAAVVAAIGLLLMTFIAPFALLQVIQGVVVQNDPVKTFANIVASENLFRIAIVALLSVATLDILVAWALNILFKSTNPSLSILSAWFRVVYAVIFAVATANLINIMPLIHSSGYAAGLGNQISSVAMLSVDNFYSCWNMALIFFGIHLFLLGILILKSGMFPKFLAILILIAGLGYLIDGCGKILVVEYALNIGRFTFIGEFLLIFWLFGFARKKIKEN